jgi:hypothetical protein
VGSHAVKAEFAAGDREHGMEADPICVAWMPREYSVHIPEETGMNHIDLVAAALLRRRPVIADGSPETTRLQVLLNGNCGQSRGRAQ